MNKILTISAGALMMGTTAFAGGIERGNTDIAMLFEDGNYFKIGFSSASPDVSGTYPAAFGGGSTGDMATNFTTISFAYKHQLSDQLSLMLQYSNPYGANAAYGAGPYTGLAANWSSDALTGILKYQINDNMSVYGGLRAVKSSATIAIPAALVAASGGPALPYTATGAADTKVGYIVGGAYERPDIALRVGLTYESKITHELMTTETIGGAPAGPASNTSVELPQSLTLDFQSGVAADTLVFGSIKWAEWSKYSVGPAAFVGLAGAPVVALDNDTITWKLGVGRKINENLSIFGQYTYEKANGGVASRLVPTDGRKSIGLGGSYTQGNMKITAGMEYAKLGDAVDGSGTMFTGNTALGFGLSVGFKF